MVESGCLTKYSATNLNDNNANISFKIEEKFSNSDETLGFDAQSLSLSTTWLKKSKNADYKKDCLKNIYKYANSGETDNEKTSMCRIAELARYHKLKHEYVLFDESGPAHMKCFTVKLILCPEQEFVGTGPSIKKAQQSAAGVALQNTTLVFPPQRVKRSKRDELDSVVLLKQLASQLNLTAEFKNSQMVCISNKGSLSSIENINSLNTSPVQLPVVSTFIDLGFTSQNVLPIYSRPPPAIISLQCSKNLLSSSLLNYNFKFLNTNNLKKPLINQPLSLYFNQINKSSYLPLPQNKNFNNNKGYQIHAQPNQMTSQNCFINFLLNNSNNCDKNLNSLQQIHQYQRYYNGLTSNSLFSNDTPSLFFQDAFPYISNSFNVPSFNSSLTPVSIAHQYSTPPLPLSKNKTDSAVLSNKIYASLDKKQTKEIYQMCLELSDGSKHMGCGLTKAEAKSNAATQALKHLRPLLEKLQANIKHINELEANEKEKNIKSESEEKQTNLLCDKLAKNLSLNENEDLESYFNYLNNWFDREDSLSDDDHEALQKYSDKKFLENDEKNIECNKYNFTNSNKKRKKSIVSMIHECAFQLRMNVEFEMLIEEGEPHNRQFTVRCRLTSPKSSEVIEANGKGPSKKAAKQNVCQIIYDKIKEIDIDTLYLASVIVRNSKKNALYTHSKANKRKIIVKQRRSDPQYGHWINPVSRLMQVMQANNLPEPIFKLLGEQGQNRSKEFVIEVKCFDNIREEGVGQNKKLAKRAAAEAMLRRIGFIKPMPEPGKSLLKKSKESQTLEINVFDPTYLNLPSNESKSSNLNEKLLVFSDFESNIDNKNIETFADVENLIKIKQKSSQNAFNGSEDLNNTLTNKNTAINLSDCSNQRQVCVNKRRVTFSNQVSACPSPDDATYPASSVAPLKSEVFLVSNKLRKRGRDSKKILTNEEKITINLVTQLFLSHLNNQQIANLPKLNNLPISMNDNGNTYHFYAQINNDFQTSNTAQSINTKDVVANHVLQSPKQFLDIIARIHKFSVVFSDFPKTQDSLNEKQCFSLVTLGIDKPIVCPGSGHSEDEAHEDAALNAIKKLSQLSDSNLNDSTLS